LRASADDFFSARVNGITVGSSGDWHAGRQFNDIARHLKPGKNVLAIRAENRPANLPANPAGLIVVLELEMGEAELLRVTSDSSWSSSKTEEVAWDTLNFDDSGWSKASAVGKH